MLNDPKQSASPNDRFRRLAVASLKKRALERTGIKSAPGDPGGIHLKPSQGIALSDKAAKLIAMAVKSMLKS